MEEGPMDGCAFCDIVANPSRARLIYADAHTMAFFPLTPATRGHTLIAPREHSPDLWAMDQTAVQRLTRTVLTVGRALRAVLEPHGVNIINSAGAMASQTVFHTHVHLVPRWPGDAMGAIWPPPERGIRDNRMLDALARQLAAAISRPGS
jgi:histidine triad (HIT) family protein